MRVSVFAGRANDNQEQRQQAVSSAVGTAAEHRANLLILPGWSLGPAVQADRAQQSDFLQGLANRYGVSILAEVGYSYMGPHGNTRGITTCLRPGIEPQRLPRQCFTSSKDATAERVAELANYFRDGGRIARR